MTKTKVWSSQFHVLFCLNWSNYIISINPICFPHNFTKVCLPFGIEITSLIYKQSMQLLFCICGYKIHGNSGGLVGNRLTIVFYHLVSSY